MKPCPHHKSPGFTLVEIMIVVAIIGLLATMALPAFLKARKRAQAAAFVSDLRVAAAAFQMYALEKKGYPADCMPGQLPAGMAAYLGTRMNWAAPTPIGGSWDWDNGQFGFKAGVSVYQPPWTSQDMQMIDQMIDDGNLSTGTFQQRSAGYIFVIED